MVGAALGIVLVLLYCDVGILALGKFAVYLALAVALPGIFAWRLLLASLHSEESGTEDSRPPTWFEDLSLGTIFGFGLQLPFYLVGVWMNVPLLFLILPVTVVVLSAVTPFGRRAWTMPTGKVDVRVSWSLAAIIMYAVAWLGHYLFGPRPLTLPVNQTPSADEPFHAALISEILHRFPPEFPHLLGARLDYHWFVHAQMAADHWATQLSSQVMLTRLMPVATISLGILGLGAVALRLSGRHVAAVIAPALLIAGSFSLMGDHYDAGRFTEAYLSRRFVSSPSMAYGFMMALPPIMLILEVLRPDRKPSRLTWVALALALFALSGSKATFMPLFLCGAIAVWVLHLVFKRTFDRTAASLVGLLLVVTIFAQVVLFGGNSGGMRFDPLMTFRAVLRSQQLSVTNTSMTVMTVTILVGWLLYGVGAFGLARHSLWRDPRAVWMFVSISAGITIAFVLFTPSTSHLWFTRSVAELVALISAWGLVQLLPNPLTMRHALPVAGVAASAGLGAFLVSKYFDSGTDVVEHATYPEIVATALTPFVVVCVYLLARQATRLGGGPPRPGPVVLLAFLLGLASTHVYSMAYETLTQHPLPERTPSNRFAPGGVPAARWIARHSHPDDIVATNVHCQLKAPGCETRNFWVAANSERRIVVEGWGYTRAVPSKERLEINDDAFTNPSAETVGRLVDAYGVKFLFVSKAYPADISGLSSLDSILKEGFRNENYVVFKLLDS